MWQDLPVLFTPLTTHRVITREKLCRNPREEVGKEEGRGNGQAPSGPPDSATFIST